MSCTLRTNYIIFEYKFGDTTLEQLEIFVDHSVTFNFLFRILIYFKSRIFSFWYF